MPSRDREEARWAVSRRKLLGLSFATAVTWAVSESVPVLAGVVDPRSAPLLFRLAADGDPARVFPAGVASGDPRPDGIVLWTRVDPATAAGRHGRVAYEISADPAFAHPLVRGVALTGADRDWTVKVAVTHQALRPFTTYYYRFIVAGIASRTGRFKTLPAPGSHPGRIRFAYLSCQDYTNGYYTALGHLADEDVDFVVHLGDYIYETIGDPSFQLAQVRRVKLPSGRTRAEDLGDYRALYQIYKSDRDLQRVHERFAFLHIWDDHEFANDCYGPYDSDTPNEAANYAPARRLAASQAWAEYTPTGVPFDPAGGPTDSIRIYRDVQFGDLITLVLTDERLYRDGPPCGLGTFDKYLTRGCANRLSPTRTMLGSSQRQWFLDQITGSSRIWKIWANEVMCMQLKLSDSLVRRLFPRLPAVDVFFNLDQWDGYPAERAHLLREIHRAGVDNFVAITGDLHSFAAGYLRTDFDDPGSPAVGVSLLGGSVTSANFVEMATLGLGGLVVPPEAELTWALVASNPHLEYFNSAAHGYVLMDVTRDKITCTMKAVRTIRLPRSPLLTLRSFEIPRGETRLITRQRGPRELGGLSRTQVSATPRP